MNAAAEHVIYVENVRACLGSTRLVAEVVCETLCREGLFVRYAAYLCPEDGRVLLEIREGDKPPQLPVTLACEICEGLEVEPPEVELDACRQVTFYRVDLQSIGMVAA